MKDTEKSSEKGMAKESFLSMAVSLLLVGGVLLFIFGFKYFLGGQNYRGDTAAGTTAAVGYDVHKEYLDTDKNFKARYIMIKNVTGDGFYATEIPGKKDESAQQLENGQLIYAVKRGTYDGETYYHLKNGLYLRANQGKTQELSSYEKLSGYVVITYISSSGVRLRSWGDFDDDNVVASVYVGDKVYIKGKITTVDGTSAYITSDGLYLTTDIRYLNDYTDTASYEGNTGSEEEEDTGGED